jgi:hypothetical protein
MKGIRDRIDTDIKRAKSFDVHVTKQREMDFFFLKVLSGSFDAMKPIEFAFIDSFPLLFVTWRERKPARFSSSSFFLPGLIRVSYQHGKANKIINEKMQLIMRIK